MKPFQGQQEKRKLVIYCFVLFRFINDANMRSNFLNDFSISFRFDCVCSRMPDYPAIITSSLLHHHQVSMAQMIILFLLLLLLNLKNYFYRFDIGHWPKSFCFGDGIFIDYYWLSHHLLIWFDLIWLIQWLRIWQIWQKQMLRISGNEFPRNIFPHKISTSRIKYWFFKYFFLWMNSDRPDA